jgi:hypothetical protein
MAENKPTTLEHRSNIQQQKRIFEIIDSRPVDGDIKRGAKLIIGLSDFWEYSRQKSTWADSAIHLSSVFIHKKITPTEIGRRFQTSRDSVSKGSIDLVDSMGGKRTPYPLKEVVEDIHESG